jgi:hypothetical protein
MIEKPRFEILNGARVAVTNRENMYGSPAENYDRVAAMINVILKDKLEYDITPADAVLVMCGIKLARLINQPDHADSQVDLAGYAAILSEVA